MDIAEKQTQMYSIYSKLFAENTNVRISDIAKSAAIIINEHGNKEDLAVLLIGENVDRDSEFLAELGTLPKTIKIDFNADINNLSKIVSLFNDPTTIS